MDETMSRSGRSGMSGKGIANGVLEGRTALLAGASGLVGYELVKMLLADPAYRRVTVLVRQSLRLQHEKLVQRVIDFDRLADFAGEFETDDIFCCLGTTIKKAGSQAAFRWVDQEIPVQMGRLARERGAGQFSIVTAMGAEPRSRIFYNQVKGATEAALMELGLPALHIFRPSLLLGRRSESRRGEAVASVLFRFINPLLVGSLRRYRAIPAAAVARAMWLVAKRGQQGTRVYRSDEIADVAAG